MKFSKIISGFVCFLYVFSTNIYCQTCCSGGVPLSSNIGLPYSLAKTFQFNFNFDFNELKTLRDNSDVLDNPGSHRRTQTIILQSGYSFSNKLSFDLFIPFVRQERTSTDFEYSNGLGDLSLLVKYVLFKKEKNASTSLITGGIGLELPSGKYNLKSNLESKQFLLLSPDMQPGSGSIDGMVWFQITKSFSKRPSTNLIVQAVYKYNGKNKDFNNGLRPYQFGQEYQIFAGISDQILVGKMLWDPALLLKFRESFTDKSYVNEEWIEMPASGGKFIFVNPSLTYWVSPKLSFNLQFDVPLFVQVTSTQISPTYRFNFGFFYKFTS